ncbi:MAG TPA: MOSC N-terminal beta barrel domain-containing protein [Candidatus Acidoferrales bacterium]|nr:MOSC N-terminal beta barrel domain-containing protein [Candidatus Acidoferrales bacterium]
MQSKPTAPRLAHIQIHPIKSLDPVEVPATTIGSAGSLQFDRAWAIYSLDGRLINATRVPALHLIRATYEPNFATVTLAVPNHRHRTPSATFAFPADTTSAATWFSKFLAYPVMVRHDPAGIPDDLIANGPTIISTASLQAVCDWFPGMTIAEARLRFRTTLELDGVPRFWEDQLFGPELRSVVRFHIGEVAFEGSYPCIRCPIPARDPQTGADIIGFQKRFAQQRRAHLSPWSHANRFEHFYCLATNTRIASTESGKRLHLGDSLVLS